MTATQDRTIRLGTDHYPVVFPNVSDPRLHLAAVTLALHVLGQVALGFRVSVPQIVVAIATAAAIEAIVTFRRDSRIVWPASAILTGSGIGLILRVVGTEPGDHWTWTGWYWFAGVSAVAMAAKHLGRFRGQQLFNPSNTALVAAFVIFGETLVEPLDFWWAPFGPAMVAAYIVILAGGVSITRRLGLFAMASTFWLSFVSVIGVAAASGHAMTARWSFVPLAGTDFFQVLATSPEVLVFVFFMITDPRTIPRARRTQVAYALVLGAVAGILVTSQPDEFGAKVGLLGSLVVLTPARFAFDRAIPAIERRLGTTVGRGAFGLATAIALGAVVAVVALNGTNPPEDGPTKPQPAMTADAEMPPVESDRANAALVRDIDPDELALGLARALDQERQAALDGDITQLQHADTGVRLVQMENVVRRDSNLGVSTAVDYQFDSLTMVVGFARGPQGGPTIGLIGTGTRSELVTNTSGEEVAARSAPFHQRFDMELSPEGMWMIALVTDL